jgi:hypothetical protein
MTRRGQVRAARRRALAEMGEDCVLPAQNKEHETLAHYYQRCLLRWLEDPREADRIRHYYELVGKGIDPKLYHRVRRLS